MPRKNTAADIFNIVDNEGNLVAVQIPFDLWQKLAPYANQFIDLSQNKSEPADDLKAFESFLQVWDFRYPYSPAVKCPNCQATSSDWKNDHTHPFTLTNANIGGLLVFHCNNCGATVRQKYFRDHMTTESTPSAI